MAMLMKCTWHSFVDEIKILKAEGEQGSEINSIIRIQ
jgi:hypothetical protein